MRSLRTALTLWYTLALAAAVLAFGLVLTVLQRRAAEQALVERLSAITERVSTLLVQKAQDGRGALVDETLAPRVVTLRADVLDRLRLIPGLVLVVGPDTNALYGSPEVQRLTPQATDELRRRLFSTGGAGTSFRIALDHVPHAFVATRLSRAGPKVVAVAVGEPAIDAQLALGRLAASVVVVVPIILAFAALVGYLLADRALRPVGQMIDELEAITDGRSLHRRLPAPQREADEVGRLANALNGLLARLETSFAALRRFVADASHELRTPLTVMRAGVERALTEQQSPPEVMQPLEETLAGVRHMTDLVDALLTLARVDEGRMELHREAVDLGAVLTEVHETAQILGEAAGVAVTLELPAEPVVVSGDRGRLRQLAMNLATNAVKYTPAGGAVWLVLTGTGTAATISVRDTGVGIAPGDVGRVFDRFWRAELARSRTGERPGFGLGLSISKWIAEAHGGSIAVTSRPGRGTTFTVTLPRAGAVMES